MQLLFRTSALSLSLALTSAIFPTVVSSSRSCPPLGAILPAPQSPSSSTHLAPSIANLTSLLDATLAAHYNDSAVAIAVQSIHEDAPLFTYYRTPKTHAGPSYGGGGKGGGGGGSERDVDGETIFRVGSVSKLVAALAALQLSHSHGQEKAKIDLDASVLKYIPQLANSSAEGIVRTPWEDVTVRSLTSHLSGLSTNTATDISLLPIPWTQLGLPPIANGTGPACSAFPGTAQLCTKADLIRDLNRRPPVYRPYAATPVYSNTAFALLGLVIEAATGRAFKDVVREQIFEPAGMNSSSFDGPVGSFDKMGFVAPGETTWNATLGVYEPAGGMFSSTRDLLRLGHSILTSRLLPPPLTRAWLHPLSHTSSPGQSVGAPWEILRADSLLSPSGSGLTSSRGGANGRKSQNRNRNRIIDVYTKTGDLGLYHAHLALLPSHDLVASVIVAGGSVSADSIARTKLLSETLRGVVPAVERAGRDEARRRYVGRYVDEESNSTLSITMSDNTNNDNGSHKGGENEDDGTGLILYGFSVHGVDVLANMDKFNNPASAAGSNSSAPGPKITARLYPTDVTARSEGAKCGGSNGTGVVAETAWRAIVDTTTDAQKDELDSQLFYMDGSCETWFGIDGPAYNYFTLTEFVFLTGKDGVVTGVRNPAFNVTMSRST
ncbi:hypothetical protein Purlil1_9166 [Purpureocillium lilacinum]|uniref:Beta-lactamase-related domain-containing protein n=1 Tax=Purpureocillium lilacinum TaxID=33203 RepID=A0ABR0BRD8_PURLI|nr:hypothetical protein Purlil1_9166 [Purpureocillium lilacinum]